MVTNVVARVQVTVEIAVRGENWNEHTTMEQVQREGEELAVKQISKLCERYVKMIGTPLVEAVITRKRN